MSVQDSPRNGRPRVVIIGGGFAGVAAAQALRGSGAQVLLLDGSNHHCFQPLLYQVATAALAGPDVAWPIRYVMRGRSDVTVLMLAAEGVDPARRVVKTTEGEFPYDFLIVATGAAHSYFGHADWAARAPGLKSVEDATLIRRRLLTAFEQAEATSDDRARARLLTFVIVGGGPTGVELAGAIAELARRTLPPEFHRADPRKARILLLEAGPRILSGFPERLSTYARRALERMGVEVRTGTPVEDIGERMVVAGGDKIDAGAILWAAGVRASPAGSWLGAATGPDGRVAVKPDLTAPGLPEVFVAGDLGLVTNPDGTPVPALAASAKQMGWYAGRAIRRRLAGQAPKKPFRYRDHGSLATIGRRAAIVKLGRLELTGFPGWLFWSVAHVYFLVNLRTRLFVAISWIAAYFTYHRGARIILKSSCEDRGAAPPPH
ncbi:NAD(P)/FAD-dependent oxidoreductase [Methylocystis echinoides]|uniref:NADH:ubiquinone reductase (non-electrogenic) n=1 Tax=Methylocystis echinoides TaxID=29468 RepID=A0A9W6GRZ9_9HYPH|nr:NAD(P)/FAD-dependent oxidoreductase [Methylocystis echinoides]GLI91863.1 NADH dehydrogenase [Methylocystis echinoides]